MSLDPEIVQTAENEFEVRNVEAGTDAWCSVWITLDNFSIYIKCESEGIVIDVYPKDDEMAEAVATLFAFNEDVDPPLEEV